jgi:cell division protein FtsQ
MRFRRRRRKERVVNQTTGAGRLVRLLARSVLLAATIVGVLLGFHGFEPLAARWAPELLVVERVSVIGSRQTSPQELVDAVAVRFGTPVLSVDRAELVRRVELHPWVRQARVALLRPGRIVVEITEREPAAVTRIGRPPTLWLVDADGTPFAPTHDPRAAQGASIAGPADADPGTADGRLREGVRIARALRRHGIEDALEVEVAGAPAAELPAIRLALGPRVLLGPGDLDAKLARLTRLLSARLGETTAAEVIDLRFGDRMVLRSGPPGSPGEAVSAGGDPQAPGLGRRVGPVGRLEWGEARHG